jgi:hypothetical protein
MEQRNKQILYTIGDFSNLIKDIKNIEAEQIYEAVTPIPKIEKIEGELTLKELITEAYSIEWNKDFRNPFLYMCFIKRIKNIANSLNLYENINSYLQNLLNKPAKYYEISGIIKASIDYLDVLLNFDKEDDTSLYDYVNICMTDKQIKSGKKNEYLETIKTNLSQIRGLTQNFQIYKEQKSKLELVKNRLESVTIKPEYYDLAKLIFIAYDETDYNITVSNSIDNILISTFKEKLKEFIPIEDTNNMGEIFNFIKEYLLKVLSADNKDDFFKIKRINDETIELIDVIVNAFTLHYDGKHIEKLKIYLNITDDELNNIPRKTISEPATINGFLEQIENLNAINTYLKRYTKDIGFTNPIYEEIAVSLEKHKAQLEEIKNTVNRVFDNTYTINYILFTAKVEFGIEQRTTQFSVKHANALFHALSYKLKNYVELVDDYKVDVLKTIKETLLNKLNSNSEYNDIITYISIIVDKTIDLLETIRIVGEPTQFEQNLDILKIYLGTYNNNIIETTLKNIITNNTELFDSTKKQLTELINFNDYLTRQKEILYIQQSLEQQTAALITKYEKLYDELVLPDDLYTNTDIIQQIFNSQKEKFRQIINDMKTSVTELSEEEDITTPISISDNQNLINNTLRRARESSAELFDRLRSQSPITLSSNIIQEEELEPIYEKISSSETVKGREFENPLYETMTTQVESPIKAFVNPLYETMTMHNIAKIAQHMVHTGNVPETSIPLYQPLPRLFIIQINEISNPIYVGDAPKETNLNQKLAELYEVLYPLNAMVPSASNTINTLISETITVQTHTLYNMINKQLNDSFLCKLKVILFITYKNSDINTTKYGADSFLNSIITITEPIQENIITKIQTIIEEKKKLIVENIPQNLNTCIETLFELIASLSLLIKNEYNTCINIDALKEIDNNCDNLLNNPFSKVNTKTVKKILNNIINSLIVHLRNTIIGIKDFKDLTLQPSLKNLAYMTIDSIKCDFFYIIKNVRSNYKNNKQIHEDINNLITSIDNKTEIQKNPEGKLKLKLDYLQNYDFIAHLMFLVNTNIDKFNDIIKKIFDLLPKLIPERFKYKKVDKYEIVGCRKPEDLQKDEKMNLLAANSRIINALNIYLSEIQTDVEQQQIFNNVITDINSVYDVPNSIAKLTSKLSVNMDDTVLSDLSSSIHREIDNMQNKEERKRILDYFNYIINFFKTIWSNIRWVREKKKEVSTSVELTLTLNSPNFINNPAYIPKTEKQKLIDTIKCKLISILHNVKKNIKFNKDNKTIDTIILNIAPITQISIPETKDILDYLMSQEFFDKLNNLEEGEEFYKILLDIFNLLINVMSPDFKYNKFKIYEECELKKQFIPVIKEETKEKYRKNINGDNAIITRKISVYLSTKGKEQAYLDIVNKKAKSIRNELPESIRSVIGNAETVDDLESVKDGTFQAINDLPEDQQEAAKASFLRIVDLAKFAKPGHFETGTLSSKTGSEEMSEEIEGELVGEEMSEEKLSKKKGSLSTPLKNMPSISIESNVKQASMKLSEIKEPSKLPSAPKSSKKRQSYTGENIKELQRELEKSRIPSKSRSSIIQHEEPVSQKSKKRSSILREGSMLLTRKRLSEKRLSEKRLSEKREREERERSVSGKVKLPSTQKSNNNNIKNSIIDRLFDTNKFKETELGKENDNKRRQQLRELLKGKPTEKLYLKGTNKIDIRSAFENLNINNIEKQRGIVKTKKAKYNIFSKLNNL